MFDQERANALIENGTIEIAPLAFMRGRTLNDAFIILDEAQNTTPEQMKMALTRLGFGSKIVVTGDISQIDLPRGESGLVQVRSVLEGIDDIAFCDPFRQRRRGATLWWRPRGRLRARGGKGKIAHGNPHHLLEHREEDLASLPIRDLALFVLEREGKPINTEVSISFVDDTAMAELNERFRGMEGPTDVLSFECDNIDDDITAADGPSCPVYELGDIIIAPDVAARQSTEFGNSFEQEVSLLIVHGLLHLCGYDHIVDEEAEVMETRERELLTAWAERDLPAVSENR